MTNEDQQFKAGLTPTLRKYLLYIGEFLRTQGMSPTIAEIAKDNGGVYPSTAWENVQNLQKRGYVEVAEKSQRGISLTDKGVQIVKAAPENA